MEKQPFFSILVPTYNQAQYLPYALDSIVSQTDGDWEALVVDDGSTDRTPEVLQEYSRRYGNIRTFRKENGGVASALNRGLAEAQGKWICWLSSDDLFDPRKLEINKKEIERHPDVDFFFSYFRLLNEYTGELADHELWGPLPEPEFYVASLFHRNCVSGITICVRREAFEKAGVFDESLRYAQDYDMWLRILSVCRGSFIPEYTATSRNHSGQGSEIFPQACIYDSAKSGMRLLDRTAFEGLFPRFDLDAGKNATRGLERVLEIAADPSSFIYWLGPHPALLMRAAEWIGRSGEHGEIAKKELEDLLQRKASEVVEKNGPCRFGFMWKVMAGAMRLRCPAAYDPFPSKAVGETCYYSMSSATAAEKKPLRTYLEEYEGLSIDDTRALNGWAEVVFALPGGVSPRSDGGPATGPGSIMPLAKCFADSGVSVVVLGLGDSGIRYRDGMFMVTVADLEAQRSFLASLAPLDIMVTIDGREVGSLTPLLTVVYDPTTASLAAKGKGRAIFDIGRADSASLHETANRLLGMAEARRRERQKGSGMARMLDYVRKRANSLIAR